MVHTELNKSGMPLYTLVVEDEHVLNMVLGS